MGNMLKACVLVSGGLDSTLLLRMALQERREVYPLYVRCGFFWEESELASLKNYLENISDRALKELSVQDRPLQDFYPELWAFHPGKLPDQDCPLGSVYLPGRNLILLTQGSLLAQRHGLEEIWIGVLGKNPYSDATRKFFEDFENIFAQAFNHSVKIRAPFQNISKGELIRKYPDFPYQLNVTCLRPQGLRHCGRCYKCAERRRGFFDAGLQDPTEYLVS